MSLPDTTSRFCDYTKDKARLTDLILKYRAAVSVRLYPTVWRVFLLLTSRVGDPEKDTQVWENEQGDIIVFVMLWRRNPHSPYLVMDGFIDPERTSKSVLRTAFEWGHQRARAIASQQKTPLTVFVNGFHHDVFSAEIQKSFGYTPVVPDPNSKNIYFAKPLGAGIQSPKLPAGYTIQHLKDTADLEHYQSAYGFAQVDPAHQQELVASDEYHHLFIIDREGKIAAYCESSVFKAEWEISGQRIGWMDYVETKPAYQRQGLGQAVLSAGLAQLRQMSADSAMLVTVSSNTPAVRLYQKVGFQQVALSEPQRYKKFLP